MLRGQGCGLCVPLPWASSGADVLSRLRGPWPDSPGLRAAWCVTGAGRGDKMQMQMLAPVSMVKFHLYHQFRLTLLTFDTSNNFLTKKIQNGDPAPFPHLP